MPEVLDEVVARSNPAENITKEQLRAWIGYNCFEFNEKDGDDAYNKGLNQYLKVRGLAPIE